MKKGVLVLLAIFLFALPGWGEKIYFFGVSPKTLGSDEKTIRLRFSRILPAKADFKKYISIARKRDGSLEAVDNFDLVHRIVFLTIRLNTDLRLGDELEIRIDKKLPGVSGLELVKDVLLRIPVCHPFPALYLDNRGPQPELFLNSAGEVTFTLFKFKDDFLEHHVRNAAATGEETVVKEDRFIDFKYTGRLGPPPGSGKPYTLDIPEETLKEGFFCFTVDRLKYRHPCGDKVHADFARRLPSDLTFFHNRDIEFVISAGREETLLWVYDTHTGLPIPGAPVSIYRKTEVLSPGTTDASGVCLCPLRLKPGDIIGVADPRTGKKTFYRPGPKELDDYREEDRFDKCSDVFTDRYLYRPGSTVYIGGVVKKTVNGIFKSPGLNDVKIAIKDPDDKEIKSGTAALDEWGGFTYTFELAENAKKGNYEVWALSEKELGGCSFRVDYYQPDTIRFDVTEVNDIYRKNDIFNPVVRGYYLSGSPMSGGKVTYDLSFGWFDESKIPADRGLGRYRFRLDWTFIEEEESPGVKAVLNDQGVLRPRLQPGKLGVNAPATLCFSVEGESKEGKEFSSETLFSYFPGDRFTGIDIPWSNTCGKTIEAKLAVVDSEFRPAAANAVITLYRFEEIERGRYEKENIRRFEDLSFTGEETFSFKLEEPGWYAIRCDTADNNGDIVSTSHYFSVYRAGSTTGTTGGRIPLRTDKENYRVGEKIRLSLHTPHELHASQKGKALVTVEKDRVLDFFVIDLEEITELELDVPREYFPGVDLEVVAVFPGGIVRKGGLYLDIFDPEKYLNVEMAPGAKEILPGVSSKVTVKVTDSKGKGKKAGVFVYAVNEGTLQLSDLSHSTPDLFENFYYSLYDIGNDTTWLESRNVEGLPVIKSELPELMGRIAGGRVTGDSGAGIPGVRITLYSGGFPNMYIREIVTDKDGYFLVGRLERWKYNVLFEKEGYNTCTTLLEPYENFIRLNTQMERYVPGEKTGGPVEPTGKGRIHGIVTYAGGVPMARVPVLLYRPPYGKGAIRTAFTDDNGNYRFDFVPTGKHVLKFKLDGFYTSIKDVEVTGSRVPVNAELKMKAFDGSVSYSAAMDPGHRVSPLKEKAQLGVTGEEFETLLRKDFREVLFFEQVETDENGTAEVDFKSSDMLSTYRLMAAAYTGDCFGETETGLLVSKGLYVEEAMPEFARENDRFKAGVVVNNRTPRELPVEMGAVPENIIIDGKKQESLSLSPNSNQHVSFDFHAPKAGEAEIKFYAVSPTEKDALLKKIPVYDNLVSETELYFGLGKTLKQRLKPKNKSVDTELKVNVAPSILDLSGKIARELIYYPYECLEQRASKTMPFLILDEPFIQRWDLGIDAIRVRESVRTYLDAVPEFMNKDGGLSYYRDGRYVSDYLTVYVLWSLRLARRQGYDVDAETVTKIERYLKNSVPGSARESFYQFVLSLDKTADVKSLEKLYRERKDLSLLSRVFLYRAVNNQFTGEKRRKMLKRMLSEFNRALRVEADFAYFDLQRLVYDRELPFYSSRLATAVLLQGILEVEGDFPPAPRIMNWLLEVPPYTWRTTHVNFWVLYAIAEYARTIEKDHAAGVELSVSDENIEKRFRNRTDVLVVEKKIETGSKSVDVEARAAKPVYLTTEMTWKQADAPSKSRGIKVKRNVYDERGKKVDGFVKGETYQVELLVEMDKELPYGVVDAPFPAGFEVLREDLATTRYLTEFNTANRKEYFSPWSREEHAVDRVVYYSYRYGGKTRFVYFVKALYPGTFTWFPTVVQGMYHPQYFGRTALKRVTVKEK